MTWDAKHGILISITEHFVFDFVYLLLYFFV